MLRVAPRAPAPVKSPQPPTSDTAAPECGLSNARSASTRLS